MQPLYNELKTLRDMPALGANVRLQAARLKDPTTDVARLAIAACFENRKGTDREWLYVSEVFDATTNEYRVVAEKTVHAEVLVYTGLTPPIPIDELKAANREELRKCAQSLYEKLCVETGF